MTEDIDSLLSMAYRMDPSPMRLEVLERAVALADAAGDVPLAFDIRDELMTEATFSGHPEKLLSAFTWCLAQCDRDPETFAEIELLWKYKWAVAHLRDYPQISRDQIESTLADMAERFRRNGASLRAIFHRRCMLALGFGDGAMLAEHLPQWKKHRRDDLSDCLACERNDEISVLAFQGDHADAVRAGEALIKGRLRCAEIPHKTYAQMLLPLVRLGRWDHAAECHLTGFPMVRSTRGFDFQEAIAEHMIYLAMAGDTAKSLKTLERHVRQGLTAPSPLDRYFFHRAATLVLRRAAATGKPVRKLKLPEEFPQRQESGEYALADLAAWFEAETRALAARFDARAGNTYRTDETNALTELEALADSAPKADRNE